MNTIVFKNNQYYWFTSSLFYIYILGYEYVHCFWKSNKHFFNNIYNIFTKSWMITIVKIFGKMYYSYQHISNNISVWTSKYCAPSLTLCKCVYVFMALEKLIKYKIYISPLIFFSLKKSFQFSIQKEKKNAVRNSYTATCCRDSTFYRRDLLLFYTYTLYTYSGSFPSITRFPGDRFTEIFRRHREQSEYRALTIRLRSRRRKSAFI